MMRVFVYGTLKRGHGNNCVFPSGSRFLYEGTVEGKLVSLGGFPGLLKDTEGTTHGEVWDVPDIAPLDMLEGNGRFYTREEVLVNTEEDIPQDIVWTYKLPKDEYAHCPVVENYSW